MKLFRRLLARGDSGPRGLSAYLRANHPARPFVEEASAIADILFDVRFAGSDLFVNVNNDALATARLLSAIDAALSLTAGHPDLLFAKSEAQSATGRSSEAELLRREVLRASPGHFDATMRDRHEGWPHLYTFPGWSEGTKKVPAAMLSLQASGEIVQVVRHGLTSRPIVLLPMSRESFPAQVEECRWRPMWVDTPEGPLFEHYVMLRLAGAAIHRTELMISPFPLERANPRQGHWLIRRICAGSRLFLAFNDGRDVLFNVLYAFPADVRRTLEHVRGRIANVSHQHESEERLRRASDWYTAHAKLEDVRF